LEPCRDSAWSTLLCTESAFLRPASTPITLRDSFCGSAGSILALGLKLGAWWVTGSVALYSDALETIINVVAPCAALVALRISAKPADADHPYGHQKAEYFSAVLEGMMVIGAAAGILHEVYNVWRHPEPLQAPLLGMLINGVATLLNGAWAACFDAIGQGLAVGPRTRGGARPK
jgi:cation diffusion facilitator family transporter